VRLRLFVAISAVLLVVVGATIAIYARLEEFNGPSDQVVGPAKGVSDAARDRTTTTKVDLDDAAGALEVHGEVTVVHVTGAVPEPRTIGTPLTIVSDRGFGNGADVTRISIAGKPSSIVWDGGRPFVLSSGKGLTLGPVTVDLDEDGLHCTLGRDAHRFQPGTYQLDTPVAIGEAGVATGRESVQFTADDQSQLEAHGNAALVLPPEDQHTFLGSGQAHLEGTLVVDGGDGGQRTAILDLSNGDFDLTFSPTESGHWTVSGKVRARVLGDLVLQ